jgi:hypothetical protein
MVMSSKWRFDLFKLEFIFPKINNKEESPLLVLQLCSTFTFRPNTYFCFKIDLKLSKLIITMILWILYRSRHPVIIKHGLHDPTRVVFLVKYVHIEHAIANIGVLKRLTL